MGSETAFLFPGQGSQKVGMGQEWAEAFPQAREAFEEADDALSFHLSRLMWGGPEEELQLTANAQPAILACSVAILRVASGAGLGATAVAGHSLGEYSAHVAAGSLGYADALVLVRQRGQLMQEAVPVGEGAMVAVVGLSAADVEAVAREASSLGVCVVANYNAPEQAVLAGVREAVERGAELAEARGAMRVVRLAVSAPFHSPLMRPAREGLEPLLRKTRFDEPAVPVVCNVDAAPVRDGESARDTLIRQVDSAVRWVGCVRWMLDGGGVTRFVEVGPGSVLTGLGRRIERQADWHALGQPAALDKLLARL